MKTNPFITAIAIAALFTATSCQKENSLKTDNIDFQSAIANTQAIAIAGSNTSPGDSIYLVNTCQREDRKAEIQFSALLTSITDYLTANYAGYTAKKAIAIKDESGTIKGYVTVIDFNGNPVGLKFDASGKFIAVLEQREGRDLREGHGWHEGGHFDHRDGRHRDTVALNQLPAAVLAYFSTNYATDTLAAAFKNRDGNLVVISKNNGVFATVFNASGTFISRADLPAHHGRGTELAESALPSTITNYLTSTYPGYVFNKAFQFSMNGNTQGYVVIIEANSTRYAVQFDASGTFLRAKPIR